MPKHIFSFGIDFLFVKSAMPEGDQQGRGVILASENIVFTDELGCALNFTQCPEKQVCTAEGQLVDYYGVIQNTLPQLEAFARDETLNPEIVRRLAA